MRLNACWERWTCCRIAAVGRSVAQPGSAPVSGSGGRKFESYRSDHLNINSRAPRGVLFYAFNSHECLSHRILHRTLKASIPSRMSSTKERKRECLSLWSQRRRGNESVCPSGALSLWSPLERSSGNGWCGFRVSSDSALTVAVDYIEAE